jgi:hypothetical protein
MMTLASSVSYSKLIDDARVVIYDRHMFIVQATDYELRISQILNLWPEL